ncbi:MAG: hypothetical protein AB1411_06845 [Nitrospirota bacterium]
MGRKTKVMRRTWKVVLESEPYGREEFDEDSSFASALAKFNRLAGSAEEEFRKDRIQREVSLVCVCVIG